MIEKSKYDAFRKAILKSVPRTAKRVAFSDLHGKGGFPASSIYKKRIGPIRWYPTVIQLDLEARGKVRRISGSRAQRLRG